MARAVEQQAAVERSKATRMQNMKAPGLFGEYRLSGFVVPLAVVGTSGCGLGADTTAETTGIVVGGAAGTTTGNPFIGLAAGLRSSWGVKTRFEHYEASQLTVLQDVIAQAAGNGEIEQATE